MWETSIGSFPYVPQPGIKLTAVMCPDPEPNPYLSLYGTTLQLSHASQGGNWSIDAKMYVLKDYKILNQVPTLRQIILQYMHQRKNAPFMLSEQVTNEWVKP